MTFSFDTSPGDGRVPDSDQPSAYIRELEQEVASLTFAGKPEAAAYVQSKLDEAKAALPVETAEAEAAPEQAARTAKPRGRKRA